MLCSTRKHSHMFWRVKLGFALILMALKGPQKLSEIRRGTPEASSADPEGISWVSGQSSGQRGTDSFTNNGIVKKMTPTG